MQLSVNLGQLADYNVAAVVDLIGAGGQGNNLVLLGDFHVGFEGGHGLDGLNIGHELLGLIKVVCVGKAGGLGQEACNQVQSVVEVGGGDVNDGVSVIVLLACILSDLQTWSRRSCCDRR